MEMALYKKSIVILLLLIELTQAMEYTELNSTNTNNKRAGLPLDINDLFYFIDVSTRGPSPHVLL